VQLLLCLACAVPAAAHGSADVYVNGAAGTWANNFSSGSLVGGGGGAEWLVAPQVGVAGEVQVLTTLTGGFMAMAGVDSRVHLHSTRVAGEWSPYALAGYARLRFFEAADHALQFGAGVDHALGASRAIRFEVRDLVRQSGVTSHYWTVRVGVAFR
jgi:hypothetical protein